MIYLYSLIQYIFLFLTRMCNSFLISNYMNSLEAVISTCNSEKITYLKKKKKKLVLVGQNSKQFMEKLNKDSSD